MTLKRPSYRCSPISRQRGSMIAIGPESVRRAEGAVSRWFDSDQSLADLMRQDISAIAADARKQTVAVAADVSRTVVGEDVSGALLRSARHQEVDSLDLPLAEIARNALVTVAEPAIAIDLTPWVPLGILPVKRSLWDWVLFRSSASVRRHLLGPDDLPARPVTAAVKQRRLAGARPVLVQAMRQRLLCLAEESLGRATNEVFGRHVAAVCRALRDHLQERVVQERQAASDATHQVAALSAVLAKADSLALVAQAITPTIADIRPEHETSAID